MNTYSKGISKAERLKSRKQIGLLFQQRQSVGAYPLRVFWRLQTQTARTSPVSIGFSVSKKNFKRAVKRNRYKRLMRELFRLHKSSLYQFLEDKGWQLDLMLVYVGKTESDYQHLEKKYQQLLGKLIAALEQSKGSQ